jgi:EAL domain-containing protein (putative c-di-GMP-specific phosphodiesterase class I)
MAGRNVLNSRTDGRTAIALLSDTTFVNCGNNAQAISDILTIDKLLVAEVADNSGSGEIVREILMLGHSLGKAIIAEGVETTAQMDFLRHIGCRFVPGFAFAKPMPDAAFRAYAPARNGVRPSARQAV